MESRMVRGDPNPTPTPDRAVFSRALLGNGNDMGEYDKHGTFTLNMSKILAYEASASSGLSAARFSEGRIKRVEVWDNAPDEASDNALQVTILPDKTITSAIPSRGDGASFRDFGTPGEQRAHIAIIPNFDFRSQWRPSGDALGLISIVQTGNVSTANPPAPIVRITLELR